MKPMEEAITNSTSPQEEKVKLKALKCPCPRCNSTNTKFCYYNNYSLAQPRYLCKACKRYWTQGGSLRSIPVGGRSRKNKRPSSSKLALNTKLPDLLESSSNNVTIHTNPNHLNLGFTPNLLQLPTLEAHFLNQHINYMPMQASYPNSVYPVGFSLEGFGGGGDGGRRVSFPFEDLRSITTSATAITATADSINPANTNDHRRQEHTRDHDQFGDSTGYWTGNIF